MAKTSQKRPRPATAKTTRIVDPTVQKDLERLRDTRPTLFVIAGSRKGGRFPLNIRTTIGRGSDCIITVPDSGVSSQHVEIVVSGDHFHLRDLGSTNGTLVNGNRVTEWDLQPGDRILIGSTMLRFLMQTLAEEQLLTDLETRAVRDELTGLPNRREFGERLAAEIAHAQRHSISLSLLMVDVDFFKRVNDTFGHPAGDHVLRTLAAFLARSVRAEDLAARIGGEEFAVLLRDTDQPMAWSLAERIRQGARQLGIVWDDVAIPISISIGAATATPINALDAEALVKLADQELYRAKQAGRNRVCSAILSGGGKSP